jgi:adenosine deaminase/aminodeoxyfutalosine deaminase
VSSLAEHPLPALVAAGVPVSINSDDPPMFGTTLNREYEIAAELLGLDRVGVAELSRAAVRASFLDEAGKASLVGEIDGYLDDYLASASTA